MDEDFDAEEFIRRSQESDLKNIHGATNRLIDSVSKFAAAKDLEDLQPEDFVKMLNDLDFAKFIFSGVTYSYGLPLCDHDHDEDDDD
jgi:hypothetical protein